jgi:hypothetical protein
MEIAKWIPHPHKAVKAVSNMGKSIKRKIKRARLIFLLSKALGQNESKSLISAPVS